MITKLAGVLLCIAILIVTNNSGICKNKVYSSDRLYDYGISESVHQTNSVFLSYLSTDSMENTVSQSGEAGQNGSTELDALICELNNGDHATGFCRISDLYTINKFKMTYKEFLVVPIA